MIAARGEVDELTIVCLYICPIYPPGIWVWEATLMYIIECYRQYCASIMFSLVDTGKLWKTHENSKCQAATQQLDLNHTYLDRLRKNLETVSPDG